MYKYFLLALVILSGIIALFIFKPSAQPENVPVARNGMPSEATTYQNQTYGFSFEYTQGASGYVLEEGKIPQTEHSADLMHSVVLTQFEAYQAQQSAEALEGPETIQILVYKNTLNQSPFVWAQENPYESNSGLVLGQIEEAVVGGANAARYLADGLYVSENYVVAHGGYVYLLSGMRSDMDGQIADDFDSLVASFSFERTIDQI